jgi:hypothetical protein
MFGAIRPTFVTEWCIQQDDTTLNSVYVFEAKRILNMLSTINGKKDCLEIIQRYRLPMFVNHAMDQLSNVKDSHVLMEWESVSDGMRVDFVTVQESGSG